MVAILLPCQISKEGEQLVARVLTRSAAVRIVRMLVGEEVSVLAGVVLESGLRIVLRCSGRLFCCLHTFSFTELLAIVKYFYYHCIET